MNSLPLNCGRLTMTPSSLWSAIRRAEKCPRWWPFDPAATVFTHRGRDAIWQGIRELKLQRGDQVLVPSYHCGSEVDVLIQAGLDVKLYQVDQAGDVDQDDLIRRLRTEIRMVYVIHLFGWPQVIPEVRRIARERQIPVMEDCALSLFSQDRNLPIGAEADCAIFSFPKSLGVPDGGAMLYHRGIPTTSSPSRAAPWYRVCRSSLGLLRAGMRGPWRDKNTQMPCSDPSTEAVHEPEGIPDAYYFDSNATGCDISRISRGIIDMADPAEIVRRRQQNFVVLNELLEGISDLTRWRRNLDDGVCPLAFPIFVENSLQFAIALQRKGIAASAWWWGHHRSLNYAEFPNAANLKRQLVALPIHQEMTMPQLEYVAAAVRQLTGRSRKCLNELNAKIHA